MHGIIKLIFAKKKSKKSKFHDAILSDRLQTESLKLQPGGKYGKNRVWNFHELKSTSSDRSKDAQKNDILHLSLSFRKKLKKLKI